MQTLYALDLTELPGSETLWKPRQGSAGRHATKLPELPCEGFASPLGFWFAAAESWPKSGAPLRVEIVDPGELKSAQHTGDGPLCESAGTCRRYRAQVVLGAGRGRAVSSSSSRRLILEIDSNTARIGVDADAWSSVAEPVLIVIAQFWRFLAMDRLLDELADWARADLQDGGFWSLIRPGRSRPFRARQRLLQALILDLPDSEGLLTNPGAYLAPGRPVRIYRALAGRLGLDRRRRVLDERVEVVEAVFDSLAESLNHHQALASQVVLELVIVTVLVLDVGLYLLDMLVR
jgi:hypothetical protein